jgi:anti-anti-sigma regulatory factor
LADRLRALRAKQTDIRLDLTALCFIDCAEASVLIKGVKDAHDDGRRFQVEGTLTCEVRHALTLMDAASCLVGREG